MIGAIQFAFNCAKNLVSKSDQAEWRPADWREAASGQKQLPRQP